MGEIRSLPSTKAAFTISCMGQDSILTRHQKLVFENLAESKFLTSHFYFTGGTALTEVYLKHRLSDDLDFFSENHFEGQSIFEEVSAFIKANHLTFQPQRVEDTHIYFIQFSKGSNLKANFAYYPHKRLNKGVLYKNFEVDSEFDIAVNKLLLVGGQRVEIKDFVDLYFLLSKFTIWELIDGVKAKFDVEFDHYILASDLLECEGLEFLPRLIRPLRLADLKKFYRDLSKSLSVKSVIK